MKVGVKKVSKKKLIGVALYDINIDGIELKEYAYGREYRIPFVCQLTEDDEGLPFSQTVFLKIAFSNKERGPSATSGNKLYVNNHGQVTFSQEEDLTRVTGYNFINVPGKTKVQVAYEGEEGFLHLVAALVDAESRDFTEESEIELGQFRTGIFEGKVAVLKEFLKTVPDPQPVKALTYVTYAEDGRVYLNALDRAKGMNFTCPFVAKSLSFGSLHQQKINQFPSNTQFHLDENGNLDLDSYSFVLLQPKIASNEDLQQAVEVEDDSIQSMMQ